MGLTKKEVERILDDVRFVDASGDLDQIQAASLKRWAIQLGEELLAGFKRAEVLYKKLDSLEQEFRKLQKVLKQKGIT